MTHAAMLAEAERLMAADVARWTRMLDLVLASVLFRDAWQLTSDAADRPRVET